MTIVDLRSFVIRNRLAIRNGSLLVVGLLVALYLAYAVDLFVIQDGLSARQMAIELDEALLVGALLAVVLLLFGARHYLAQKREMVLRIAAERQARELAYQDGLTGLPNRRQFDDALRAAIAAPPREGASHGVFLLDLNGFKRINDVHGHGIGDDVLIVVARRLAAAMRDGDMVARFGGDEFAILATHLAGPEAATSVALRVIAALEPPITAGGTLHRVGVGIGIALVPGDAGTIDEALRKSDVALYRAKAERRSALRFFEPEMDARVLERAEMEQALRDALDQGLIIASYRPAVHLRSREVTGFEAAARWSDPQRGDIPLERFVSIAEEAGLIHVLAERVLRQACETARQWPSHISLSVDIYPSQLKDELLPARIVRILAETGLSPSRLEVEITESALVADMDAARAALGALRAAGVRVALDNFGTGYSSLYHLRNFKLDKIKIDSSFIHALASEQESAGIVDALVGLGRGLGLVVAAEGVDTLEQEASLLGSGCQEAQGRRFTATLSGDETLDLIAADRNSGTG